MNALPIDARALPDKKKTHTHNMPRIATMTVHHPAWHSQRTQHTHTHRNVYGTPRWAGERMLMPVLDRQAGGDEMTRCSAGARKHASTPGKGAPGGIDRWRTLAGAFFSLLPPRPGRNEKRIVKVAKASERARAPDLQDAKACACTMRTTYQSRSLIACALGRRQRRRRQRRTAHGARRERIRWRACVRARRTCVHVRTLYIMQ